MREGVGGVVAACGRGGRSLPEALIGRKRFGVNGGS